MTKFGLTQIQAEAILEMKLRRLTGLERDKVENELQELLARIRATIRTNNEKKQIYNVGNIFFNKGTSKLSSSKAVFHLNNKESDILEILINNQQKVISANELKRIVWNTEESTDSGIPMYISYLPPFPAPFGAVSLPVRLLQPVLL